MSRGGYLLAESTLFTLPSLLFAVAEGAIPARHCFFFLSTRCATELTFFSFYLPSFSHQAGVLRARQSHGLQHVARRSPARSSSEHAALIIGHAL
jgi:hypothetical protein